MALLSVSGGPPVRRSALPACDPGNAGLTLPEGFCAVVVADQVGTARHLVVASNGDLFVAIAGGRASSGGVLALRDTTGDGKADVRQSFGRDGGTGIALGKGVLYASSTSTVYRYTMRAGSLTPLGDPDVIVKDLPAGGHGARNLAARSHAPSSRGMNRAPRPGGSRPRPRPLHHLLATSPRCGAASPEPQTQAGRARS
jgi:hypothetical protein